MSSRRGNNNKSGDGKGQNKSKRSRKSIPENQTNTSYPIVSKEVVKPSNPGNLSQVVLRFKKVDYISLTSNNFSNNFLTLNFMLKNFDLDFFKFFDKSIVFFYGDHLIEKVGKIKEYSSIIENGVITLQIELVNIINKDIWEREWMTEEFFYNEYVLGLNKFWYLGNSELDSMVGKLGLKRKSYEDDIMFKRRVVNYLQLVLKPSINILEMLSNDSKGKDNI